MKKVFVDLKRETDNSYDIEILSGSAEGLLRQLNREGAYFIIDKNVSELYAYTREFKHSFILEASEHNKSFSTVERVLKFLLEGGCLRNSTLVALGGGVTGDIGGFAASIYMRGIDFIQVPTTLLSMVDSSVGGKTGVNLGNVKNVVGSFYQPKKVIIDPTFLNTLSFDEFKSGVGEVVKYGLMFDATLYHELMDKKDLILSKGDVLGEIILRCCEIKAEVVRNDERENGLRMFLNFGHTVGHAIETDSNHEIKHGFAIATGMYVETLYGKTVGEVSSETFEAVKKILLHYEFPLGYIPKDMAKFTESMRSDKKAKRDGILLSLTEPLGSGKILKGIEPGLVTRFLTEI